MKDMEVVMA